MAADIGRDAVLKKNAVAIAGVTQTGLSVNNEPVDITSNDSAGYRTILGTSGTESIDISVEGVYTDDVLRDVAFGTGSKLLTDITFAFANGDTLSGDFFLATFEETNPTAEATTFSASFQSSGAYTFTPSA